VDSSSERALEQIAQRQGRRRRFNERLAELDPDAATAPFRCECGLIACGAAIRLSADAYAEVRSDARWFAVHADHVLAEADRVVMAHGGWVTIEKPAGVKIEPPSSSVETRARRPTSGR
jgi:hypothetical protein